MGRPQLYDAGVFQTLYKLPASYNVKEISANYTITDNDGFGIYIVTTGASDKTITLPVAADNKGRVVRVVKVDNGIGQVIIDGSGNETINGELTFTLRNQYDAVQIVCTGSGWVCISKPAVISTSDPSGGVNGDVWFKYN